MRIIDIDGKSGIEGAEKYFDSTYESDSVVAVYANNYLQTCKDINFFFEESHRVINPSGFLFIIVPIAPYRNAFDNPNTIRFFTGPSFMSMIDKKWNIKNFNISNVKKDDPKDPNTWMRTLEVKLQPIKV